MGVHLGHLAISAPQDELSEESRHPRPPIVLLHVVEHAKEPFVSSGRGLMKGFYKFKMGLFGDVKSVFKV